MVATIKENDAMKRFAAERCRALITPIFGVLLCVAMVVPLRAQEKKGTYGKRGDLEDVAKSYEVFGEQLQTMSTLQSQLQTLAAKRRAMQSEQAYIDAKISWAKTKLAGRGSGKEGKDAAHLPAGERSSREEVEKWMREVKAWESRGSEHAEGLAKVVAEEGALMKALRQVARSRDENDMLIPGELLELYVAEDESFNGLYQVRAGGYIVIPRLPKIYVAGKTLKEVEETIRGELGKSQLRDATVTVDRVQAQPEALEKFGDILYLTGQVVKPGPWPIPVGYEPTAVTVLLRVPVTMFADLERVQVLRLVEGRALMETINVQAIMDGQALTPDFALEPNDIVIVPAKDTGESENLNQIHNKRRVYVQGNVIKPGIVNLYHPARMTALAAIRHSGGPNRNADLMTLELIRIERERTRREILNLGAIMRGEEPDVNLLAEDILVLYGKDERVILAPVRVYLSGNVKKPGPYEIKGEEGELTVMQALMHSGGYARFSDLSGIYVLREMGNGIRNRIPVNMKKVQKGIIPDLILKDNDVIVVPEKFFSF